MIYNLSEYPIIGHGGTKTVHLINENKVIYKPNPTDGQSLINIWNRIVDEEIQMSSLLSKIGILTLKFTKVQIKLNDQIITTHSSVPFSAYIKDGIYIIDTKNHKSTQWQSSLSIFPENIDQYNVNSWLSVMKSYINDVHILVINRLSLSGDSLNLAFVKNENIDIPFIVRIFGFDFASKRSNLDISILNPDEYTIKYMLKKGAEFAIWEQLCPKKMFMSKKEQLLYQQLSDEMIKEYYRTI